MLRQRPFGSLALAWAFASWVPSCTVDDDHTASGPAETGHETTPRAETSQETGSAAEDSIAALRILDFELNQGVGIPFVREGRDIPVADRNARPIAGRPALFRMAVAADPGFSEPGFPVVLEVELSRPGLPPLTQKLTRVLDVEASALDTTVLRGVLPAAVVVEGATLSVLVATTSGRRLVERRHIDLDLQGGDHVVRVFLAPFRIGEGDCAAEAEISTTALEALESGLFELMPASRVELTVRDTPVVWRPAEGRTTGPGLLDVTAARRADGVPPDTFYFAVFPVCKCDLACDATPRAAIVGPTRAEAPLRVGYSQDIRLAGIMLVHEIGHMLGRLHVGCSRPAPLSSDPGELDPAYPRADGGIGTDGYSVVQWEVVSRRNRFDIMSYCVPRWTSDVYWEAVRTYLEAAREWR